MTNVLRNCFIYEVPKNWHDASINAVKEVGGGILLSPNLKYDTNFHLFLFVKL